MMDIREGSAMTEASGLANEGGMEEGSSAPPIQSPSQEAAMRWADRLRKVTMKAPLRSLFAAFLLGLWVARRR